MGIGDTSTAEQQGILRRQVQALRASLQEHQLQFLMVKLQMKNEQRETVQTLKRNTQLMYQVARVFSMKLLSACASLLVLNPPQVDTVLNLIKAADTETKRLEYAQFRSPPKPPRPPQQKQKEGGGDSTPVRDADGGGGSGG